MVMDIFFTFGIYNFDRKRSKANASVIFSQLLLKFVSITLSEITIGNFVRLYCLIGNLYF